MLEFVLGPPSRSGLDANSGRSCQWYGLWMRIKDPHSYVVMALRDSLCYFIKHRVFIWKIDFMKNLIFGLQDFRKLVILNFLGVHYWKLDIWVSDVKSSGKDTSHIAMSLDMCVCDPLLGTSNSTNKSRCWDQVRLGIVSSSLATMNCKHCHFKGFIHWKHWHESS